MSKGREGTSEVFGKPEWEGIKCFDTRRELSEEGVAMLSRSKQVSLLVAKSDT